MCIQCHSGLSSDIALRQLEESLKNPQFEKWNTTSLSHILICIRGMDGPKGHEMGNILAEQFYKWFLGRTNGFWQIFYSYNPCLEFFPHSSVIRKKIDDANTFYHKYSNQGKTREQLFHLYLEELKDEPIIDHLI